MHPSKKNKGKKLTSTSRPSLWLHCDDIPLHVAPPLLLRDDDNRETSLSCFLLLASAAHLYISFFVDLSWSLRHNAFSCEFLCQRFFHLLE